MTVVADSSGLIAAFNKRDPEHVAAAYALDRAGYVVISPLALAEIDYVVRSRASQNAANAILERIRARVADTRAVFAEVDGELLGMALSVRLRYRDLDLDLADAVNVAIAARYRTNRILTLDRRDFRTIRPLTEHAAFHVLPDDQ